jgi:hypothetical protein
MRGRESQAKQIMKSSIVWDITPRSPLKVNATCFMLVSCLPSSSALKMETSLSETQVDFQRTTRRYIPENRTVHTHHYENLKSHETSEKAFRSQFIEFR